MTFKILSCDGGGIRGLITAMLIEDLDASEGVISNADGYAGTSTGGLIALGLANGVPINNIVDIYKNDGKTIFETNSWFENSLSADAVDAHPAELAALGSGPGMIWTQYKNDGLKRIAANLLGGATMDSSAKLVLVNSARLWDPAKGGWDAATISSAANNQYKKMLMQDAALATSAAPTYFPPYQVGADGYFADGGLFANNPAVTAISEALSGGFVSQQSDLRVLSLGTGITPQGIQAKDVSNPLRWGVTHWLWPMASGDIPATALLALTMDATAEVANINASKMLGTHYCRGNVRLPEPYGLDDWKNISDLLIWTQKYIASPEWSIVKKWVSQNWT